MNTMIPRLLRLMPPGSTALFVLTLVAQIGAAVLEIAAWCCLAPIIRAMLADTSAATWWWVAAGCAAGWVVCSLVATVAGRRCGYGLSTHLHRLIGGQLSSVRLTWFAIDRSGQVSALATAAVMQVMSLPAHLVGPLVTALVTPVIVLGVFFWFSIPAALVAVALLPALWVTYRWTSRILEDGESQLAAARAEGATRVIEYATAQRTLRLAPHPEHSADLVRDALADVATTTRRMVNQTVPALGAFIAVAQIGLSALVAVVLLRSPGADPPVTVMLLVLCFRFALPLKAAADLSASTRLALGSLDRLDAFLAEPVLAEPQSPIEPEQRLGRLTLENVTAAYGKAPVVQGANLDVAPGSTVAIVGASGSGKTTVLRLAARFMDPDSGTVSIDGVDLRNMSSTTLRGYVSVVFQDIELFDGTLADNIMLGNPTATREQLHQAIHDAHLNAVIDDLPDGLDTVLGAGGVTLSGGQCARVSIARALLKDAPILLLDEATAHLDSETSASVVEALHRMQGRRTVVMVTHDVASTHDTDHVYSMTGGRLVPST